MSKTPAVAAALALVLAATLAFIALPAHAAPLTDTDVEPATLAAGAVGKVTATFTTTDIVPANGAVSILFPFSFDVSGATGGTCTSMDGAFGTTVSGQTVLITRGGSGTGEGGGPQTCTVDGIRNPQVTGGGGSYALRTLDGSASTIDEDTAVPSDTFTPGVMTSPAVTLADTRVGRTGTATAAFTATNPIPPGGSLQWTFPVDFGVSGASAGTCASMDGGFSTSLSVQTVTITRDGTGTEAPAGTAHSCTLAGIQNPSKPGATGTYILRTRTGTTTIDENTAVTGSALTAGALSNVAVQPGSGDPGAVATAQLQFTNGADIPGNGRIVVVFPAGFDVSGAKDGTCPSMNGAFSTKVSAQTVTLTRAGGSPAAPGGQTCRVANVKNPVAAGTTADYTVSTAMADGTLLETATAAGTTIQEGGPTGSVTSHSWPTRTHQRDSLGSAATHTFGFSNSPVSEIVVHLEHAASATLSMTVFDQPGDLPEGFTTTTIWVEIGMESSAPLSEAVLGYGIPRSSLPEPWQAWSVLRHSAGFWSPVPTTAHEDGINVALEARAPGLGPFIVAIDQADPTGDVQAQATAGVMTVTASWSDNRGVNTSANATSLTVDGVAVPWDSADGDGGVATLDVADGSRVVVLTVVDDSGRTASVSRTYEVTQSGIKEVDETPGGSDGGAGGKDDEGIPAPLALVPVVLAFVLARRRRQD